MIKTIAGVAALLSTLILSPVVEAVPISRVDIPASATNINFDTLTAGTTVDTQYQGSGVMFSSPAGPGGVITFFAPGQVLSISSELTATFGVAVDMVGVDVSSNTLLTLEAYDSSNSLIESVNATSLNQFLGLSSTNKMISKVIIHDHGYGFAIDNFSFVDPPAPSTTAVPEPGTLLILGSGLLSLSIWEFRKNKK